MADSSSRKRQKGPQGQPIAISVAAPPSHSVSPALGPSLVFSLEPSSSPRAHLFLLPPPALFPSAQPPSKTPFILYSRDGQPPNAAKDQAVLAAETDDIEYESRNHLGYEGDVQGEAEGYSVECVLRPESSCRRAHELTSAFLPRRYMIGVHNPRTNTLTLHAAPLHTFTPTPKSLKPTAESLEASRTASLISAQRALLGSTFGTKKAIRALNAQQRNKLNSESFGTGAVSAGLQSHLQASIQASSASLPNPEAVEIAANLSRPIPPPNLAAQTPSEAYSLADLVSPAELNALDLSPFLSAPGFKERNALLPYRRSNFIATKLRQILPARASVEGSIPNPSKKDRERLKLLIHLSYLFQFRQTVRPGQAVDRSKLVERLNKPSPAVVDALLERYTEGTRGVGGGEVRKMTSFTELKLLGYMLVVVLRVDGYSTDVTAIADDLGMGNKKVQELFRSLGCTLAAPSSADREKLVATGQASTLAEAAKSKKAVLKVPLVFPKERKGVAKR
ncbi:SPOSA6832_04521 [Sporobolomyces salmonicolor]|uniref:SPOSA6832_04521-mRNA-1:cds n=1 Tax=Sporidiobolus salmonicolor TaxID=5005 RepID=A0A0D6ERF5_SPOSA|nr:SPOSA6832_04521 [Sporobolomyces salmonicolor]